ncbi:MAG TPA: hypothetical protein VJ111_04595 [Chitinophagaceae bacterium]|nr:hypothetical protein [Chitinophagaceae bacterium]
MQEKWWEKGNPNAPSIIFWPSLDEAALSVQILRLSWVILKGNGVGETIYRTPSGVFRAIEEPDGTLVRLERLDHYEPGRTV